MPLPHVVDKELDFFLISAGAVIIEGSKACGKTATALQRAKTPISIDRDQNAGALAADTRELWIEEVSIPTAMNSYVDELTCLGIIEDLSAWNTHLRSRHAVTCSPKRFFDDPSVAVASLGGTPERLMKDLEYMGSHF